MSRIVPPTRVVVPAGTGGGSRIGSWPSVDRPPEVAELSRISVLGCCGAAGWAWLAVSALSLDFFASDFFESCAGLCPFSLFAGEGEGCTAAAGDCWGFAAGGWAVAGFEAGAGAWGVASGVCGNPDPDFGSEEVGDCWALAPAVTRKKMAASKNGQRCICLWKHRFQSSWMQIEAKTVSR